MEDTVALENLLFHLALSFITVLLALLLKEKLFRSSRKDQVNNTDVSCGGSRLASTICERCPVFNRYDPVCLWGRSGHIQTLAHGIFGRFGNLDIREGDEKIVYAGDGATLTYDVFKPKDKTKEKSGSIILVVPGIGNNSSAIYIQAFIRIMVNEGFTVAIANHLGTKVNVPLTSPRIFTYGGTEDLTLIINDILQTYKSPKIIGIGFSMGANVLLKLLGENPKLQSKFVFAASICQGYDIESAAPLMLTWKRLARIYNWAMCRTMKRVLLMHKETFKWWETKGEGHPIDWEGVSKATCLQQLDEVACKHIAGYKSTDDFYYWNSSSTYSKDVNLPILYINASDDPVAPPELWAVPRQQLKTNPDSIFVATRYGGHLGFFKGGFFSPCNESWLDDALKQYVLVSYDLLANSKERREGGHFK